MISWRKLVITVFLLLSFVSVSIAAEVSPNVARQAAENWLQYSLADKRLVDNKDYRIVSEEVVTCNNQIVGYNFILAPQGHILVPSRDELPVVKLYSFTTSLSMASNSDVVAWIKGELCEVVDALAKHPEGIEGADHASTNNDQLWARFGVDAETFLRNNDLDRAASESYSKGPLLATTWDQDSPYNNNTPLYNGTRTLTGCVATATAQIMKFWNYPTTGKGSKTYTYTDQGGTNRTLSVNFANSTYSWGNMLNSYAGSSTAAQKAAVAKLMYEVGVAYGMQYGTSSVGGSSATTTYGVTVLPTYFKYKDTISAVYRSSSYGSPYVTSDSAFMKKFKTEVDAGRPSLFRIRGAAGGHSIVCDGYRDSPSEQIHVNMGWSGSYNGWYASNNMVTGSYNWNTVAYQAAVIGISPSTTPTPVVPVVGGGGGGGGGGCFIATAAFGTPMERNVQILRDFRDRVLLTTSAGQAFVKFYYEVSPPIAGKIAQSEGLRFITRASLMPFVGMAYLMVTYGAMATLLIGLTLILMAGALVMIIRRKMMVANS